MVSAFKFFSSGDALCIFCVLSWLEGLVISSCRCPGRVATQTEVHDSRSGYCCRSLCTIHCECRSVDHAASRLRVASFYCCHMCSMLDKSSVNTKYLVTPVQSQQYILSCSVDQLYIINKVIRISLYLSIYIYIYIYTYIVTNFYCKDFCAHRDQTFRYRIFGIANVVS
jgi:hypothetical protein